MIYLPDYFNDAKENLNDTIKQKPTISTAPTEVVVRHNGFVAKYIGNQMYPTNTFGLYSYRYYKETNVDFFQDDVFLFSKITNSRSSIVIHGKNESKLKTENFFTIREKGKESLSVYDFEGTFIKNVVIGPCAFVEFKRVSDKYAIGMTEEFCTYDPFTGLFDLDIMFDMTENSKKYPKCSYDNSRRHIPLTSEDSNSRTAMMPILALPEGFIVQVKSPVTYKFIDHELGKLVTYDDAFNGIADFYEGIKSIDILELLGLNDEQKKLATDALNSTSSTVYFKLDKLNDNQKSDLFQKISDAYDKAEEINKSTQFDKTNRVEQN